jgi:hypothetical protein
MKKQVLQVKYIWVPSRSRYTIKQHLPGIQSTIGGMETRIPTPAITTEILNLTASQWI